MKPTNNFKPILFNTEMVQAILAGRKTQTRRVIKADFPENSTFIGCRETLGKSGVGFYWCDGTTGPTQGFFPGLFEDLYPKYEIDHILWVKETFYEPLFEGLNGAYYYKADLEKQGWKFKWKPSLLMPKEAARIFLKVTNVRCERLNDISEEDAIAEGCKSVKHYHSGKLIYKDFLYYTKNPRSENGFVNTAKISFETLWDSINAKKHPWESNPWVWVYDFERIEKPENFLS